MAYWDNIAAEEEIEEAVEKVEKILGKSGRMLPTGKTVAYNIELNIPKFGMVWYGDIDTKNEQDKLIEVAKVFNVEPSRVGYWLKFPDYSR